jgi:hypothetical protein
MRCVGDLGKGTLAEDGEFLEIDAHACQRILALLWQRVPGLINKRGFPVCVCVRACALACANVRMLACLCIAYTSPSHALLRAQIPGLSLVLVTEVHDFPADEYGQNLLRVTA